MRAVPPTLLAAALLGLGPASASAAEPPPRIGIRLRYILGPGTMSCPPEQTLHDEVARRMGYDPFTPDAADRVVTTVSISRRGSTSTIKFDDNTGGHRWEDKTIVVPDTNCMVLVTGIALYISTVFIPFTRPPPAATPSPPPSTPPPPVPPPAEAPVPLPQLPARASRPAPEQTPRPTLSPPSPSHRSWFFEVGISPFVAFGIAPGVGFGGALHVGVRWPLIPFSVAAEGHLDGSVLAATDALPHALVKTLQVGGAVVPCWRPFFFLVCGVATGSQVFASAAISDPKAGHNTSFRAGGRLGLEGPISNPFAFRFFGEALGLIKPARVGIGAKEVWRTPPLSGDVGVAVVGYF